MQPGRLLEEIRTAPGLTVDAVRFATTASLGPQPVDNVVVAVTDQAIHVRSRSEGSLPDDLRDRADRDVAIAGIESIRVTGHRSDGIEIRTSHKVVDLPGVADARGLADAVAEAGRLHPMRPTEAADMLSRLTATTLTGLVGLAGAAALLVAVTFPLTPVGALGAAALSVAGILLLGGALLLSRGKAPDRRPDAVRQWARRPPSL